MVVATMTNKRDGYETLLIDKVDLDELKMSLKAAQAELRQDRNHRSERGVDINGYGLAVCGGTN